MDDAAIVAALVAILVALLSTGYQAVYAHNENRRKAHWDAVAFLADLVASAQAVVATSTSSYAVEAAATTLPSDHAVVGNAGEALAEFERDYAKLSLIAPGLRPLLTELRSVVRRAGARQELDERIARSLAERLEALTMTLLETAPPHLRFPFVAFLPWRRRRPGSA